MKYDKLVCTRAQMALYGSVSHVVVVVVVVVLGLNLYWHFKD